MGTSQQKISVTWTVINRVSLQMSGATWSPTGFKYASMAADLLCSARPCGAEVFCRVRALFLQMIERSVGQSPLKEGFHWDTSSLIFAV